MNSIEDLEKRKETARKYSSTAQQWFAACEDGHFYWDTPPMSYENAVAAANSHDSAAHGGQHRAQVMPL
jgi:hypothetical protein